VSDESTVVGAAFTDALNNTRYFAGRSVIARESARYAHPRAKDDSPLVTSRLVDKVLLSDGCEVWQCRTCGDISFEQVLGALSHAAAHNRKKRVSQKDVDSAELTHDEDFVEMTDTDENVTAPSVPTRAIMPQDLRGIIRNLTAIKIQQQRMHDALAACVTELSTYTESTVSAVSADELEELRDKAAKFDQMRGLFS
jgi:hypothetical protein